MAKTRVIEAKNFPQGTRGRKPSDVVYVEVPPERPEELFGFNDEPEGTKYMDAALGGVLIELGERDDEAKVVVKRRETHNGVRKDVWLFECHPKGFSIPDIQEHYGAGDYRVTVYGNQEGSNYKKIVHADKLVSIGDTRDGKKPDALAGVPALASSQNEMTRALTAAISEPLRALAGAMAQMMPKQTSRADVIAEMTQLATLMQTMKGETPVPVDPLAALERAVSLMTNAKGAAPVLNEDGEVSPNAILAQGIALVREFFQAAKREAVVAAAPMPALSAPVQVAGPVAPAAPATAAQSAEDAEMKLFLKMQTMMLLNAARNDGDPETYAALIYEQAPDDVLEKLMGDKWFEELCALDPGFSAFRPWCEKVRAEILAEINAPPEPEELTPEKSKRINAEDAPGPVQHSAPDPARRDS